MLSDTFTLTCYYCHEGCSERSETFVENLKNTLIEELNIDCKCDYIQGILKFEDVVKKNNTHSKYRIVICYACSRDGIRVLATELASRSYKQNGVFWASQGKVSEESNSYLLMDFESNDWKNGENGSWKDLIEKIISLRNSGPENVNYQTRDIFAKVCPQLSSSGGDDQMNKIDQSKSKINQGETRRERLLGFLVYFGNILKVCSIVFLYTIHRNPMTNILYAVLELIVYRRTLYNVLCYIPSWIVHNISILRIVELGSMNMIAPRTGYSDPCYSLSSLRSIVVTVFSRIMNWISPPSPIYRSLVPKPDPGIIIHPGGLINTKETCYMNSMIQAMAASKVLIEAQDELSKSIKDLQKDGTSEHSKLEMLTEVFKVINENERSSEETTEILKKFMNTVKWNRSSQQDAFQLLSFFINAIQKDILLPKTTIPPKLRILHSFSENPRYNKIQDHLGLAIPLCGEFRVKPGVHLKELLNAFFAPSEIDDGPNSTQLYLYGEAPDVMILHVQANEWSQEKGDYIKPVYHILYGKILEYDFIIQNDKDGSKPDKTRMKYKLVAVVHHMGGVHGGHYITYRMLGDHWFLTNDEQVEEVEFKCDVTPYIMVYEKIST